MHYDNRSVNNVNGKVNHSSRPANNKKDIVRRTSKEDVYSKPHKQKITSHGRDLRGRGDAVGDNLYSTTTPSVPPKSPDLVDFTYAKQIIDDEFEFIDNNLYSGQI